MVDDGHAVEPLAQEAHAPIDLAQALLAVGVLGVFGAIALRRRLGDRHGDPRALVTPQLIEFVPQPLGPFGGDVLRSGRSGGRYLDTAQYSVGDIQGRELSCGAIAID